MRDLNGSWEARPRRRIGRWFVMFTVLIGAGFGAASWWQHRARTADALRAGDGGALPTDSAARAPEDERIIVRVVNGSQRRGIARKATFVLRDFGYDVVDYDGQGGAPLETTEIVVHTGKTDAAVRVKRALGAGTITARADSSRYVDLTIVIGRDWRPPAEPLRP
ncbi:MAG: hypothetical protein RLZZ621_2294 [Gemmatimonadota bacterium]|jgi:hypothetical protein